MQISLSQCENSPRYAILVCIELKVTFVLQRSNLQLHQSSPNILCSIYEKLKRDREMFSMQFVVTPNGHLLFSATLSILTSLPLQLAGTVSIFSSGRRQEVRNLVQKHDPVCMCLLWTNNSVYMYSRRVRKVSHYYLFSVRDVTMVEFT